MLPWAKRLPDGLLIAVHVQPGANETAIVGQHGDALKIRLAAPPVDGKANAALVRFIANTCGAKRADVALISGETSREKRLKITTTDADAVLAALLQAVG
jgi:uncharacterized protein